jgi:hypothetical protein
VLAEGLDRLRKNDLLAVDFVTLGLERVRDVLGADRAEETIAFAGLNRERERDAFELLRDRLSVALELRGAGDGCLLLMLDLGDVRTGGDRRESAREEEVAGVAGLDLDEFAALAELLDVVLENDLDVGYCLPQAV